VAITYLGGTSTVSSASSISVPINYTAPQAGDLMLLVVGSAQAQNAIPQASSGWTYLGTGTSTFEAFDQNTGPRSVTFYWKEYATTDTSVLITQPGGTGATMSGIVFAWRRAANEFWQLSQATFGQDSTSGTAVSVTHNTAQIQATTNDRLFAAFVSPKNVTHSAQAITLTGATVGAASERQETTQAPGAGYRVTLVSYEATVTAGNGTANPVSTITGSGATYGPAGMVRIRATAGGTITAANDANNNRIGVTLNAFLSDAPTVIYRVHADGTEVPVRGGDVTISGGQAFVWDYEYPTNQQITYVADDNGARRTSNAITITDTRAWLRAPGLPGYDTVVQFRAVPERTFPRPITYLSPIGRRTTVPVSDVRKAPSFTLEVVCTTSAENAAVEGLLEGAAVAYLLWPNTVHHNTYVAIADAVERPLSGKVGMHERVWALTCTEVERPAGGIAFDPTASWQAILDTSASWTAVAASYTSWLDVLQGPEA
jgi:hypothetical protein